MHFCRTRSVPTALLQRPAKPAGAAAEDGLGRRRLQRFAALRVKLLGRLRFGQGHEARNLVAFQQPIDPHLDPRQFVAFLGRDEREGHALAAHPARAPDAMHVVVAELRHVVVDDVGNRGHVDAAAHHVGGHQDLDLSLAEAAHHAIAGRLLKVAVDGVDPLEQAGQPAAHLIGAALRAAEDDRLLRVLPLHKLRQQIELPLRVDREVELLDRLHRQVFGGEIDHFRLAHVRARPAV